MTLAKQKENVNTLLQLIKENPDLEIIPMVATDCIFDDSWGYWMAEWSKAKVTKYWCSDERVYQYDEDFDSLVEDWIDENFEKYAGLSENELEILAETKVSAYEWTDAIIVYIERL
jgi:hypothetical protein